jgi:hypothetical protein
MNRYIRKQHKNVISPRVVRVSFRILLVGVPTRLVDGNSGQAGEAKEGKGTGQGQSCRQGSGKQETIRFRQIQESEINVGGERSKA